MKLTISNYLNARSGSPSVNSATYAYKSPGDTISPDQALAGDLASGSNIWYHNSDDNCYYWSGGIAQAEFAINNQIVDPTDDAAAMQVLGEAKLYFWNKYLQSISGIAIINNGGYQLSFQFSPGNTPPDAPSGSVNFKGFVISASVGESPVAIASAGQQISGSLSQQGSFAIGTCGIKVKGTAPDNAGTYVLTNYHVAAFTLLGKKQFTYAFDNAHVIPAVMPAWTLAQDPRNEIGNLYQGLFNNWHDTALILLNDPESVSNTTTNGDQVLTSLDIFNNISYQGQPVALCGASSGYRTGTVKSVNAKQNLSYSGIIYEKDQLIQIDHISQQGDSGSPVLLGGQLIGLLIGDDGSSSYVLPIQRILNYFNLSL